MNVLLIGSGGREHGLAWKLAQSPMLTRLYAAPGNPGIGEEAELVDLDVRDHTALIDFCRAHDVELVVVGPEAPLVAGIADDLRATGIKVFGPDKAPAQLEGSKAFTKALCDRANIPTARYRAVHSLAEAHDALAAFGAPVVVKADGLAAGKGVSVAMTMTEAEVAGEALFAEPGASAGIEQFLEGEEVSLFVLTDGKAMVPFGSAQDHKRVGDGDTGPNTGGMGAYSPARVLTAEREAQALREIVAPTVARLAAEGMTYSGVLYAGLILTADGPKLIEYNARFGDPECQVLMMRLESDLLPLLLAIAEGRVADAPPPVFSDDVALTVLMAANGYPGTPEAGGVIDGIDAAEISGAKVFQAGTKLEDDQLVAAGGRVLAVTATGATVRAAQPATYRAIAANDSPAGYSRRDIGAREGVREAG